jgi:hypothetical protein
VQAVQVVEHILDLQAVQEHLQYSVHIQQSVAVELVLGTATPQIRAVVARAARVLQAQESAEAVQHSLFKVIQVVQTLEILELAVAIMGLLAMPPAFILVQDDTALVVVVAQAALVV